MCTHDIPAASYCIIVRWMQHSLCYLGTCHWAWQVIIRNHCTVLSTFISSSSTVLLGNTWTISSLQRMRHSWKTGTAAAHPIWNNLQQIPKVSPMWTLQDRVSGQSAPVAVLRFLRNHLHDLALHVF